MTAFNDAFYILKNEHMFDRACDALLRKGKAEEMIQLQQMRQFVLDNENSPDPAKRQAAEDMYQHLTRIMSAQSRTSPMMAPEGPVGEGGSMGAMAGSAQPPEHPMMKAWDNLRKNVIGTQEAGRRNTPIQYTMPPAIASMAQRPQVPEMMTQTMDVPTQAPGMFGRFKAPVMQQHTTEIPTGHTVTGGPQTMDVQQNPENPMAGIGGMGQMMPAPGAAVERMPRPSPFPENRRPPSASFAGQGYTVNDAGNFVRPKNPFRNALGTQGRLREQDFEQDFRDPVGSNPYAGVMMGEGANTKIAQSGAADQFTQLGY